MVGMMVNMLVGKMVDMKAGSLADLMDLLSVVMWVDSMVVQMVPRTVDLMVVNLVVAMAARRVPL